MTIARHTYSAREVGFFAEAALSPSSVSSVEWDDKQGAVEIYTTPDPLNTLRAIATWTKFDKPGSSGTFDVPAGTRKVAIEAVSTPAVGEPTIIVAQSTRTIRMLFNSSSDIFPDSVIELVSPDTPTWEELGVNVGDIVRLDNIIALTIHPDFAGDYEVESLLVAPGSGGFSGTWVRVRRVDGKSIPNIDDAGAGDISLIVQSDSNVFPTAVVVSDGLTDMEQARLYGVDQLVFPGRPPPPFFANVQHWFDFNDASTMFADTAGLIPITTGAEILRMENKGSNSQPIISTDAPGGNRNPRYKPFVINGWGVADGPHSLPNVPDLGVGNPDWLSSGDANGIAAFVVCRRVDPVNGFLEVVQWNSFAESLSLALRTSTTWQHRYTNQDDSLKTIVDKEWTWHYLTAGPSAAGTQRSRTSGVAEIAAAGIGYTAISATGGPFNIALIRGQTAEVYVYDRELTPAELLVNIARFDAEYGTMPFLGA